MKRVHGGYATTLKDLLAVKAWRLHLFPSHHNDEHKHFRRKHRVSQKTKPKRRTRPSTGMTVRATKRR